MSTPTPMFYKTWLRWQNGGTRISNGLVLSTVVGLQYVPKHWSKLACLVLRSTLFAIRTQAYLKCGISYKELQHRLPFYLAMTMDAVTYQKKRKKTLSISLKSYGEFIKYIKLHNTKIIINIKLDFIRFVNEF